MHSMPYLFFIRQWVSILLPRCWWQQAWQKWS